MVPVHGCTYLANAINGFRCFHNLENISNGFDCNSIQSFLANDGHNGRSRASPVVSIRQRGGAARRVEIIIKVDRWIPTATLDYLIYKNDRW